AHGGPPAARPRRRGVSEDEELERLLAEARRKLPPAPEPSAPPPPEPALPPLPALAAATPVAPPAEAPREGLLARALQLRMASILTSRYVDLKLGDFAGTAISVLQAPLIGWLVGLAF